MKISEFIKALQNLEIKYGDTKIYTNDIVAPYYIKTKYHERIDLYFRTGVKTKFNEFAIYKSVAYPEYYEHGDQILGYFTSEQKAWDCLKKEKEELLGQEIDYRRLKLLGKVEPIEINE